MSGRLYAKTLDRALTPHGFVRDGLDWVRIRDGFEEVVNLQPSWQGGRTVNLYIRDLATDRIYREIFGPDGKGRMQPAYQRLATLVHKRDHFWGDEPNGPSEMAELTVAHGLPWFDRVRTLEDQATIWYGRNIVRAPGDYTFDMIGLALTLYRMGETEEACTLLNRPVPKTAIPAMVRDVARLKEWLGCGGRMRRCDDVDGD